jgi:hypothetical protein
MGALHFSQNGTDRVTISSKTETTFLPNLKSAAFFEVHQISYGFGHKLGFSLGVNLTNIVN